MSLKLNTPTFWRLEVIELFTFQWSSGSHLLSSDTSAHLSLSPIKKIDPAIWTTIFFQSVERMSISPMLSF